MKVTKTNAQTQLESALTALKVAIVQGASWRYDHLLAAAIRLGATDADIDAVAHQALEALLAGAEQPLTPRDLAASRRPDRHSSSKSGHFRQS